MQGKTTWPSTERQAVVLNLQGKNDHLFFAADNNNTPIPFEELEPRFFKGVNNAGYHKIEYGIKSPSGAIPRTLFYSCESMRNADFLRLHKEHQEFLNRKNNKGERPMFKQFGSDMKEFVSENKQVIFWIALIALFDHSFLKGSLRTKIQSLIEKLLGGVEKRIDNINPVSTITVTEKVLGHDGSVISTKTTTTEQSAAGQ